jgi:hypothetical protein
VVVVVASGNGSGSGNELPPQQPVLNATMIQVERWGEDISNNGLDAFYAH